MPSLARRRDDDDFYRDAIAISLHEWFPEKRASYKPRKPQSPIPLCGPVALEEAVQAINAVEAITIEHKFLELANEWERETEYTSSTQALIEHRNYQQIIDLGWDVIPFLIRDLQENQRFWFPALHQITGIRPFDRSDAGDSERMLEAWVRWWEKRKQFL